MAIRSNHAHWVVQAAGLWALFMSLLLAADPKATVNLREQLGVMLQLENMLEKCPGGVFGQRAGEVDEQFALLQAAGVRWTRVGIPWEQLEPERGKLNWGPADRVVQAARRHRVSIVWMVGNTATWISSNGEWNGVPKDLDDQRGQFPHFVRKLVERYRADIHYWEIRNEPNLDYMFQGADPKQYLEYLAQAHRVIKEVDPQARVLFGGLGGKVPQQLKWFRRVMQEARRRGGKLPFDIANFHVYAGEADKTPAAGKSAVATYLDWANTQIENTMNELDLATMPVWITEFDYPAHKKMQPDTEYAGPAGQARIVTEMFCRLVEGHPERKIFWASLLDDRNTGFNSMGLIQSNARYEIGKPRPAYEALKKLLAE